MPDGQRRLFFTVTENRCYKWVFATNVMEASGCGSVRLGLDVSDCL